MKWQITLAILATLSASFAFAEDFKTINGKEYKDATLSRVEPDGIVLRTKSGISKIYFVELPKQAQERFHYDASKGNAYSAEQAEAMRQQQQATATSASKAGVMPDAIKPMTTSATATLWAVRAQPTLGSYTGSGRYAVMTRRAVQPEEGLVHVMAVYGVGSTPMAHAINP